MNKKNFTEKDTKSYSAIGAKKNISNVQNSINASDTPATQNSTKTAPKRPYNRLDPREAAPEEYKLTLKMPGELGRYIAEKAYQERTTRTEAIVNIIAADMKRHPEILRELDASKKPRRK